MTKWYDASVKPLRGERVLIKIPNQAVRIGYYDGFGWRLDGGGATVFEMYRVDPTCWAEIPTPPEEVDLIREKPDRFRRIEAYRCIVQNRDEVVR